MFAIDFQEKGCFLNIVVVDELAKLIKCVVLVKSFRKSFEFGHNFGQINQSCRRKLGEKSSTVAGTVIGPFVNHVNGKGTLIGLFIPCWKYL